MAKDSTKKLEPDTPPSDEEENTEADGYLGDDLGNLFGPEDLGLDPDASEL